MNSRPDEDTLSAKSEFSDRNPYPGWMACASDFLAISMIFAAFK